MIYKGNNKELKKEFQKILINKEITQTDVANRLNISNKQLGNYFNKVNFSFNDLYKMCDAINCRLEINIIDNEEMENN